MNELGPERLVPRTGGMGGGGQLLCEGEGGPAANRTGKTHIPIAGEANVVKLTGLTSSKKEGVRESRRPRV